MVEEIEPTRSGTQAQPEITNGAEQTQPFITFQSDVRYSGILYSDPMGSEDKGDVGLTSPGLTVHVVFDHRRSGEFLAASLNSLQSQGRKIVLTISAAPEASQAEGWDHGSFGQTIIGEKKTTNPSK